MPHIPVPEGLPGLVGLMAFKPATGARLADLIHELLRGDGPLSITDRELIAAYVSSLNSRDFSAGPYPSAPSYSGDPAELGPNAEGIDPRLRALLRLAAAVVSGGSCVTEDEIAAVRAAGSDDEEIHDTVLLAAVFCMISRYVDGLAITAGPDDEETYDRMNNELSRRNYRPA